MFDDSPQMMSLAMRILAGMDNAEKMLRQAKETDFADVTPELWGDVQESADVMVYLFKIFRNTISAGIQVTSNPELKKHLEALYQARLELPEQL